MKTCTELHREAMELTYENNKYIRMYEEVQKSNNELIEKIQSTREEINNLRSAL